MVRCGRAYAVALHFTHYSFCRARQTLRVTAAVEAGLSDHVWELGDFIDPLEK